MLSLYLFSASTYSYSRGVSGVLRFFGMVTETSKMYANFSLIIISCRNGVPDVISLSSEVTNICGFKFVKLSKFLYSNLPPWNMAIASKGCGFDIRACISCGVPIVGVLHFRTQFRFLALATLCRRNLPEIHLPTREIQRVLSPRISSN